MKNFLSDSTKELIVQWHTGGKTTSEIAKLLKRSWTSVKDVIIKAQLIGNTDNQWSSGRPRLFDIRCENRLKRLIKTHRIIRTIDLFKEFNMNNPRPFSKRCILYHVKRLGFKRRAQRSYLVVKDINRKKRRKWARARLRWPAEAWMEYIFSDECQIVIGNNNKLYIWRTDDEKDRPHLVCSPKVKKLSLMIWGCITSRGVGLIEGIDGTVNSYKYVKTL